MNRFRFNSIPVKSLVAASVLVAATAAGVLLVVSSMAQAQQRAARADGTKNDVIEAPVRNLVKAAGDANPKVEPGKVTWHATFATACAAAKKSGKPVVLFQMMGKLDDQFC